MISSLTIAATASVFGRFGVCWAVVVVLGGVVSGLAAGAVETGSAAGAAAGAWARAQSGAAVASRAARKTAPRALWPVTLRARIIGGSFPSNGRVRPQFLSSINWSAQCGE